MKKKPKISTLRLWRVDVPPQVFTAVMENECVKDINPINFGTFRVHAENSYSAFNKVWAIVSECGVPVSSMDVKIGEYPSEIECYVD